MAAPPRKPPPAPIAAPVAGLPAAAPMAAPAAAPTAVPMAAPLIVLWLDVRSVVVPVCCADHWRQTASSVWNCSKLLPSPGNTNTLGPVGIDAHAPRTSAAPTETTANFGEIIGIPSTEEIRPYSSTRYYLPQKASQYRGTGATLERTRRYCAGRARG